MTETDRSLAEDPRTIIRGGIESRGGDAPMAKLPQVTRFNFGETSRFTVQVVADWRDRAACRVSLGTRRRARTSGSAAEIRCYSSDSEGREKFAPIHKSPLSSCRNYSSPVTKHFGDACIKMRSSYQWWAGDTIFSVPTYWQAQWGSATTSWEIR